MLPSQQASYSDLFFTRGRHHNVDMYFLSQSYFQFPRSKILSNSNIKNLLKQTLRNIILLFHDIAGLEVYLQERTQLSHKAWDMEYENSQTNGFAKIVESRCIIRNCNKNILYRM